MLFARKNSLANFTKLPAENGPFQAITVVFDQALLRTFHPQYGGGSEQPPQASAAVTRLPSSPTLPRFYETLRPYFEAPLPALLAQHKQQEALGLLLEAHPALQHVLFDFRQPGKIDLEAFMRQNFRFNLGLQQLAYLTGRSLATFKRDFHHVFRSSPARWLYQQRLAEAHYLLQSSTSAPQTCTTPWASRAWRTSPTPSSSFLAARRPAYTWHSWPAKQQRLDGRIRYSP